MSPRDRLVRLGAWALAANAVLFVVAAGLAMSPRATEAARQVLVLCGLAG